MGLFGKKDKRVVVYKILIEISYHQLECQVNECLQDGWQPIGGISSVLNNAYMQAMVKYK